MIDRKKFERRANDEPPDNEIKKFLSLVKEPQTFGGISNFLKQKKRAYKNSDNRKGLSLLLNRMIERKEIIKLQKDDDNPYPRYTVDNSSKSKFQSAFDGYIFRTESTLCMFNSEGLVQGDVDIDNKRKLTEEERRIKKLVTYFGIQILYTMLQSYERPINTKLSTTKNIINRNLWLKNALSFHDPIGELINKPSIMPQVNEDFKNAFQNKQLTKKITLMKDSLFELYPNIMNNINNAEQQIMQLKKDSLDDEYYEISEMYDKIRIEQ